MILSQRPPGLSESVAPARWMLTKDATTPCATEPDEAQIHSPGMSSPTHIPSSESVNRMPVSGYKGGSPISPFAIMRTIVMPSRSVQMS